jgi:hypothetical protein
MKKIAIAEWFPRICGATDWGLHLSAGNPCDRWTFSKSGRPLKRWNRGECWTTGRIKDAAAILNEYDLVILTDVVCFAPELRENPYYIGVLNQLTVPWVTHYHGGTYPSKYDDTIRAVLASPSFTGVIITTRLPEARARLDHLAARPIRYVNHPFLPYDLGRAPELIPLEKRKREVIMTARIAVNKGQNALFELLPQLRGDVNLWGYNSFGLPSIGWRLWELGNAIGYKVTKEAMLREDALKLTHPNARKFYTGRWEFKARGGARIRYHQSYVHLDEIDWRPVCHVSLANSDFKGTLEYVTLDAMAAGCVCVVPEHAVEYTRGAYKDAVTTVPYNRCNLWARKDGAASGAIDGDAGRMATDINNILAMPLSILSAQVEQQFIALRLKHDPKLIFKRLVREALK